MKVLERVERVSLLLLALSSTESEPPSEAVCFHHHRERNIDEWETKGREIEYESTKTNTIWRLTTESNQSFLGHSSHHRRAIDSYTP